LVVDVIQQKQHSLSSSSSFNANDHGCSGCLQELHEASSFGFDGLAISFIFSLLQFLRSSFTFISHGEIQDDLTDFLR